MGKKRPHPVLLLCYYAGLLPLGASAWDSTPRPRDIIWSIFIATISNMLLVIECIVYLSELSWESWVESPVILFHLHVSLSNILLHVNMHRFKASARTVIRTMAPRSCSYKMGTTLKAYCIWKVVIMVPCFIGEIAADKSDTAEKSVYNIKFYMHYVFATLCQVFFLFCVIQIRQNIESAEREVHQKDCIDLIVYTTGLARLQRMLFDLHQVPMFLRLFSAFLTILANLYYFIYLPELHKISQTRSRFLYVDMMCWNTGMTVDLILICFVIDNLGQVFRHLVEKIQEKLDNETYPKSNLFCMFVLENRVEFNIFHMFNYSWSMLFSFVSTASVYLIILLQIRKIEES